VTRRADSLSPSVTATLTTLVHTRSQSHTDAVERVRISIG